MAQLLYLYVVSIDRRLSTVFKPDLIFPIINKANQESNDGFRKELLNCGSKGRSGWKYDFKK